MGIERVVIGGGGDVIVRSPMRRLSVLALLALGGCSMLPYYNEVKAIAKEGVYTAIEDRQKWNDVKADALLALPCGASIGSVMRLKDDRQRAILIELCGGPSADSQMTVGDIAAVLNAVRGKP